MAAAERGWLRKFYLAGSDEPQYDLTPTTEKAIAWLATLAQRGFVGTESRLLTVFELLRQMSKGSETDPAIRISELQKRLAEIDTEILRIESGDVKLLDDAAAIKDRFQQFMQPARDLLTDFCEVGQNFRMLDRRVRERIALWEGGWLGRLGRRNMAATVLPHLLGRHRHPWIQDSQSAAWPLRARGVLSNGSRHLDGPRICLGIGIQPSSARSSQTQ